LYYGTGYFTGAKGLIGYVDTMVVGYEEGVGTKNTCFRKVIEPCIGIVI
jgi:hypothetical protein